MFLITDDDDLIDLAQFSFIHSFIGVWKAKGCCMTDGMKERKAGGEGVGMEIEIFFPLLVIYF